MLIPTPERVVEPVSLMSAEPAHDRAKRSYGRPTTQPARLMRRANAASPCPPRAPPCAGRRCAQHTYRPTGTTMAAAPSAAAARRIRASQPSYSRLLLVELGRVSADGLQRRIAMDAARRGDDAASARRRGAAGEYAAAVVYNDGAHWWAMLASGHYKQSGRPDGRVVASGVAGPVRRRDPATPTTSWSSRAQAC